jgi:hypothetical protein
MLKDLCVDVIVRDIKNFPVGRLPEELKEYVRAARIKRNLSRLESFVEDEDDCIEVTGDPHWISLFHSPAHIATSQGTITLRPWVHVNDCEKGEYMHMIAKIFVVHTETGYCLISIIEESVCDHTVYFSGTDEEQGVVDVTDMRYYLCTNGTGYILWKNSYLLDWPVKRPMVMMNPYI